MKKSKQKNRPLQRRLPRKGFASKGRQSEIITLKRGRSKILPKKAKENNRRWTHCRHTTMLFVAPSLRLALEGGCATFPTPPLRGYVISQSTLASKKGLPHEGAVLFWRREFKRIRTLKNQRFILHSNIRFSINEIFVKSNAKMRF